MDMRAELGLVGSIRAVNQLMTIIEQGRPWVVIEGMRMTMGNNMGNGTNYGDWKIITQTE